MKYAVITFGCRVNQADSLAFEEDLLSRGATATAPSQADVVIVNTCSVTATSDQGARQTIRRVARENPSAKIVVTGCYATRVPQEVAALPNVGRVVGNPDKARLVEVTIAPSLTRGVRLHLRAADGGIAHQPDDPVDRAIGDGPCGAPIEPGVAGRTAYALRVQTGCAEPCSYCIIPATRGRPRSTPVGNLLRQVDRVIAAGFKEIALTGVHLGSYGRDLTPRSSLSGLLRELDNRGRNDEGGSRVLFRISSLEPMECTRDIVDLVAGSGSFAPHLHLPLQHASDRVLRVMRRPYTIDHYAALVDDIRARLPNASLGTDVIVGFPGETEGDFEQLASYLERSPLTHVHVFPYSDRPGTAASTMGGKIHGAAVRDRARRIREISRVLTERFHSRQVGTIHRALTLGDGSVVVTGNYLKAGIDAGLRRNEWVRVRITSAMPLSAELV